MKNNKKLFENATKKVNLIIEHKSGIRFPFRYFKLKINIYLYKIFYKFLNVFSDKDFYDSFIISFLIHFLFILGIIIYIVFSGSFLKKNTLKVKQENVVIFDLSNLTVGKDNTLNKARINKKKFTYVKKKDKHKNIESKNQKNKKLNEVDKS